MGIIALTRSDMTRINPRRDMFLAIARTCYDLHPLAEGEYHARSYHYRRLYHAPERVHIVEKSTSGEVLFYGGGDWSRTSDLSGMNRML